MYNYSNNTNAQIHRFTCAAAGERRKEITSYPDYLRSTFLSSRLPPRRSYVQFSNQSSNHTGQKVARKYDKMREQSITQ